MLDVQGRSPDELGDLMSAPGSGTDHARHTFGEREYVCSTCLPEQDDHAIKTLFGLLDQFVAEREAAQVTASATRSVRS
ncbi:hypothetical protein [Streptomyces rimosus]|uniref:hypothetical protein n=1 Tax=Streptomyces rimosus TaxID=1927 RepID=UPI00131DAD72|nr:hypothetical protein [Streptomyces rimosus]